MPTPDSTVGVVIPARNESARIGQVVAGVPRSVHGLPTVTCVVDDGSDDLTGEVARANGARVVTHAINLGKGAALKTGCLAALAGGCRIVVLMDADGQHHPGDLPAMVAPILEGADVVLGRRTFSAGMPRALRLGNWGLSRLFRLMFGAKFGDTQCGLRAFTAAAYQQLAWDATDYAVETEMLVRATRARLRTVEVDIATIYHDAYKGTTPLDGLRILAQMIRWRVSA